ncbi:MAG: RHS repeat-associated core domain-containing protein [Armatimonadota bacterium]|nr:RHS repeat-associated core domain-containing protein [Armatimonadota bacterium]
MLSRAKQTDVPLVGWQARGGLPVQFSLHHNSKATYTNTAISAKWAHTYDTHLDIYIQPDGNRAVVTWGNHTLQLFDQQGNQWVPRDGYRDRLSANGNGYVLTLKSQVRLEFEPTGTLNHFRLARIVDPNGNAVVLTYNDGGLLTRVTDPSGRALQLHYIGSKLTQVRFVVGAWSRTWTLEYDTNGRLWRVHYPPVTTDNGVQSYHVQFGYTSQSNICSYTDRSGQTWQYGYGEPELNGDPDALEWEQYPGNSAQQRVQYTVVQQSGMTGLRVTDPRGAVITFYSNANDTWGRLRQVRDGEDHITTLTYGDTDYAWSPSVVTTAAGTQWQLDYDANGNIVGITDAAGNRFDLSYDSQNRLTQILEPLVTDAWGNTETARHKTEYVYDTSGNLIQVKQYTSATSYLSTQYGYDAYGQLISVTDARNKVTQYGYDAHGNLVSLTTPMGYQTQWQYASADSTFGYTQPSARIDAKGQQTSYIYDEWGRLRTKTYPSPPAVQYSYDAEDRLVRMVDATGETLWQYTPQGWLASEQKGTAWRVEYSYLPNGLVSAMNEALSGQVVRTVAYAYTARNLLYQLTELGKTTTWQYDADGRVTTVLLGNGARREYTYSQGRLQSVVHKDVSGNVLASFSYSYQQNGRCKQVNEQVFNAQSVVRYRYDFLNRLVKEERTGYAPLSVEWTYDAVGNRIQQVKDGVVTNYTYDDDNRLLSAGSVTYGWDANGNMVSRTANGETLNFLYDYEDRLQMITRPSQPSGFVFVRIYNYDGLGRRVFRWVNDSGASRAATYRFAAGNVIREQWSNPNPNNHLMMDWKYTWAGGLVNAVNIMWGDQWWSGGDRLGSARVHTDELGEQVTYLAYFTAFGERLDAGWRTAYTFAGDWGYRDDGDAGLLYIGARWYDPAVGRWTSADKWLGNIYRPLSLNRYLYCEDDPVNAVDPSGYFKLETFIVNLICLGGGGAIGGGILGGPPGALAGGITGTLAAVGVAWEEGDALKLWRWIKRSVREMAAYYADHPPFWVK